jgi:intracellular septation protein
LHWSVLLLDAAPLLVYAVVDSFSTMRTALVAALVAAALEIVYSWYRFGLIDEFAYVSVGLVVVFGGLSLKLNDARYIKFKPVVLSGLMALACLISYGVGKPLLVLAMERYSHGLPEAMASVARDPRMQPIFARSTLFIGCALVGHAALVAWAALRLNKWWWLTARILGFYALTIAAMWLAIRWPLLTASF